jgi:hypothetical protein
LGDAAGALEKALRDGEAPSLGTYAELALYMKSVFDLFLHLPGGVLRGNKAGVPEAPSSVHVRTRGTNRAADGSERSAR